MALSMFKRNTLTSRYGLKQAYAIHTLNLRAPWIDLGGRCRSSSDPERFDLSGSRRYGQYEISCISNIVLNYYFIIQGDRLYNTLKD